MCVYNMCTAANSLHTLVYMYVYIHTYVYSHIYAYIYVSVYVRERQGIYTHVSVCVEVRDTRCLSQLLSSLSSFILSIFCQYLYIHTYTFIIALCSSQLCIAPSQHLSYCRIFWFYNPQWILFKCRWIWDQSLTHGHPWPLPPWIFEVFFSKSVTY